MFSEQDAETRLVSCLALPLLYTEEKVFVCKLQLWFTSPTLDSFLEKDCYQKLSFYPCFLPAALSFLYLTPSTQFQVSTKDVGCVS